MLYVAFQQVREWFARRGQAAKPVPATET
jgi:hypothetical protein